MSLLQNPSVFKRLIQLNMKKEENTIHLLD